MTNLDSEIARNIAKSKPRPASKEELRERLVTIFRLAKAAHDAEDGAESDARFDDECAEVDVIRALQGDDIYMPAAKLIIAKAGEILEDLNDGVRDTRLNAEAALGALRLFGLEDLYRECFPRDEIEAGAEEADASEPQNLAALEFEPWEKGTQDEFCERFAQTEFDEQAVCFRIALSTLYRSKPELIEGFSQNTDTLRVTMGNLLYAREFFEKGQCIIDVAHSRLKVVEAAIALGKPAARILESEEASR